MRCSAGGMVRTVRALVIAIAIALGFVSCGGGGSSPAAPTPAPRASISVTQMTVEGSRSGSGYQYVIRLTVQNTGGLPATLTSSAFSIVSPNGRGSATVEPSDLFGTTSVATGASVSSARLTLTDDPADRGYATSIAVSISYTDSVGANVATRSENVPALPATPPSPTPTTFSVCGTVKEDTGSAPVGGATVLVKDTSLSTTSDNSGQYCVNGLGTGRFTLRATKAGYDIAERDVTVSGNMTADIPMHRQSSPSPSPTPTPSPTPPTPHPGPNGPACDASSIPANATCIGNGTPPVTAICDDGAFSCSQNRSGTCSSHQGVKCWVCPGLLCNGLTISQSEQNFTPAFGRFSSVNGGGR